MSDYYTAKEIKRADLLDARDAVVEAARHLTVICERTGSGMSRDLALSRVFHAVEALERAEVE
jgi:hypothetical protein